MDDHHPHRLHSFVVRCDEASEVCHTILNAVDGAGIAAALGTARRVHQLMEVKGQTLLHRINITRSDHLHH